MLVDIVPATLFSFLLVFARIGAIFVVLPGFGEAYISPRIRLSIALAMTFAVLPFVEDGLPGLPDGVVALILLLSGEVTIGLFIGLAAKLTVSALHIAGMVISFMSSLGFAQFFDPAQGTQGALIGSFLALMGMMVIFTSDLHIPMLRAAAESYTVFPAALAPPLDSFAELAIDFVAGAFGIAMRIAAPFIVYALVLYLGMGLLNRLMPSMQVFFLVMPLNIMLSMFLFTITMGAILLWYADYFAAAIATFLPNG